MARFTLLTPETKSGRLYKTFRQDDQGVVTRDREAPGTYFRCEYREFGNFQEMCDALSSVEADGNTAIIRGDISVEMEARVVAGSVVRRTKFQRKKDPPGFQPANRDWVMIDVDKFTLPEEKFEELDPAAHPEECVEYIISRLPHYFREVSCWWQFSASQSMSLGSRTVSLHLFYMLDRTVSDLTLSRWAHSQHTIINSLPIDPVVFDCIQPHYIAPPRFIGVADPLKLRSGVREAPNSRVVFDVPEEIDIPQEHSGNIHPWVDMRKMKQYLDLIGDDVGRLGFNDAIKSVVGRYYQLHGPQASDLPLKTMIRRAILDAPLKHDRPPTGPQSIQWYMSDEYMDPLIRNIREKEQTEKEAERDHYKEALARYVYVEDVERFVDLDTMAYRTKTGITDAHAHILKQLADNMLVDGNLRRVNRITYKPGAPPFCEDFDPDTDKIFRAYNKYVPPKLKPTSIAEGKWFTDHIAYLCDDEGAAFDAIMNWLASLVQFPDEKMNFGILMQGVQGTGKSFITQAMLKVLGPSNVNENLSTSMLMSNFNEWMSGKQLICVEEIKDFEHRFRIYNHMKDYITGQSVTVNPKGLPAYKVPNRSNFLCFTNYEDAVPMDDDDRRFIIHFSKATPMHEDHYKVFMVEQLNNACGGVRRVLLERDITGFNPKGRAPMTSSKKEYLTVSGTPTERWLRESIEGDMFPCTMDLITVRDLKDCLPTNVRNISDLTLISALRRVGAVKRDHQVRLPHGKTYVWILRNKEKWLAASEKEMSEYYQKPIADGNSSGYYVRTESQKPRKDF